MSYQIKSVATLTGLPPATLRAWERRYGLVEPPRSGGGYRLYTDADVALLARVKSLVDTGTSVSEAVGVVKHSRPASLADLPRQTVEGARTGLLEALLALDRSAAVRESHVLSLFPFEQRIDGVLMPVLHEIGDRWARGEASIVQEHFATAFIREKLVGMLESIETRPQGGREAICAGAPGEAHELGLIAVAVHLALRDWRVTYLGMDVPVVELRSMLAVRRPALLCTSLIRLTSERECLEFARALRTIAPPETRVVVGGAGVPRDIAGKAGDGLHLVRDMQELFAVTR